MTPDEHRLPEVVRRLEEVVAELREMRRTMEATYVRRDVYMLAHQALEDRVTDLRGDFDELLKQQAANRRLAVSGLALPVIATVIAALILALLLP